MQCRTSLGARGKKLRARAKDLVRGQAILFDAILLSECILTWITERLLNLLESGIEKQGTDSSRTTNYYPIPKPSMVISDQPGQSEVPGISLGNEHDADLWPTHASSWGQDAFDDISMDLTNLVSATPTNPQSNVPRVEIIPSMNRATDAFLYDTCQDLDLGLYLDDEVKQHSQATDGASESVRTDTSDNRDVDPLRMSGAVCAQL